MYFIIFDFIQDGLWAIAKEKYEQLRQLYHITKGHLYITCIEAKVIVNGQYR